MGDRPDRLECPHCDGDLRDAHGLGGVAFDKHGAHLACRHCGLPVDLRDVSLPGGGRRWQVVRQGVAEPDRGHRPGRAAGVSAALPPDQASRLAISNGPLRST